MTHIAKGKARTSNEFGCKVGIAATNRDNFLVSAKAFGGNPYDAPSDGLTLAETTAQADAMGGIVT